MAPPNADIAFVVAVLGGSQALPQKVAERRAFGIALPRVIEWHLADRFSTAGGLARGELEKGLRRVWREAPKGRLDAFTGWPTVVVGILDAAELLEVALPEADRLRRMLGSGNPAQRAPAIFALIDGGSPARVLMSDPATPPRDPATAERIAAALGAVGAEPSLAWKCVLDPAVPGPSSMAAIALRALCAQHPRNFVEAIGITGALDSDASVVVVGGLGAKLDGFFAKFPSGTCFVPRSQESEARQSRSHRAGRVVSFSSLADLALKVGVLPEQHALARAVRGLAESSGFVPTWRGRVAVGSLAPLKVIKDDARWGREVEEVFREARTGLVIGGPAGSGKSVVLRLLHHRLLAGDLRLEGPALLVRARDLREGRTLSDAFRDDPDSKVLLEAALTSTLRGSVALLVDGLDELRAVDRERVIRVVDEWQGPRVIATRDLPQRVPGDHCDVAPLDDEARGRVLLAMGRESLAPALSSDRVDAHRRTLSQRLATRPFGLTILASWPGEIARVTKPAFLDHVITRSAAQAVEQGRLENEDLIWLRSEGFRMLDAAAWEMLRAGREVITADDLARVQHTTGSSTPIGHLASRLAELGVVQWCGPGELEFTHRSLAELCATRHLTTSGVSAVDAVLGAIGTPGGEEICAHLPDFDATLVEQLARRLASVESLPATGLRLAARVVAVANVRVSADLAEAIARRWLKCRTRFPRTRLPGRLDDDAELCDFLAAVRDVLRPAFDGILEDCNPEFAGHLRPPPVVDGLKAGPREDAGSLHWSPPNENSWPLDELAGKVAAALRLDLPLDVLLRRPETTATLRTRGRGAWAAELLPHFADSAVGDRARSLWAQCVPETEILRDLTLMDRLKPNEQEPILNLVATRGSVWSRREALVRHLLSTQSFRAYDADRERVTSHGLTSGACVGDAPPGIAGSQLQTLWNWLWATGLMDAQSPLARDGTLDRFCRDLLQDPSPGARRFAVQVLGRERGTLRPDELRRALADESRAVRTAALAAVQRANEPVQPVDVALSLLSLDEDEGDSALRALTADGWSPSLRLLVEWSTRSGRRAPLGHSAAASLTQEDVAWLLERAAEDGDDSTASEILRERALRPHLLQVLQERGSSVRAVAARAIASGWPSNEEEEELQQFLSDDDPAVRVAVAGFLARSAPTRRPPSPIPARPLEGVELAGFSFDDGETVSTPFDEASIERFTDLEELLEAIRAHPLRVDSFRDVEGFGSGDGSEHLEFLAGRAQDANLSRFGRVVRHARSLVRVKHAGYLVQALEHPQLGPIAVPLLREIDVGPALLPAFWVSSAAAVRASQVAHGRLSAFAAVAEFTAAAASASWPDTAKAKDWARSLFRVGGAEALLRVIDTSPLIDRRRQATSLLSSLPQKSIASLPLETAGRIGNWAREHLQSPEEGTRTAAWQLIAVAGSEDDARRLVAAGLSDLGEAQRTAAFQLLARFPGIGLRAIREACRSSDPALLNVAALALASAGTESDCDLAIEALQSNAPTWRWSQGRAAFIDLVVRRGTRHHARKLGELLIDSADAWTIAKEHGRFGEHILLAVGHLLQGGGEYVIPASVTGGGDEVVDDPAPDDFESVVGALVKRDGPDALRRTLLELVLGGVDDYIIMRSLESVGGAGADDVGEVLACVVADPSNVAALELVSGLPEAEAGFLRLCAESMGDGDVEREGASRAN